MYMYINSFNLFNKETGIIIIPIIQMRNEAHRGKVIFQKATASTMGSWTLKSGFRVYTLTTSQMASRDCFTKFAAPAEWDRVKLVLLLAKQML